MNEKEKAEIAAMIKQAADDAATQTRAEWSKTRPWRHARWESIKADPQAAACMALAGALVMHYGPTVVRFFAS